MTFWVVWNAWNRVRHVLWPTHLKQLIKAVIKKKGVGLAKKSVRNGPIRWIRYGGRWAKPLLCDWANRRNWETQPLLLPDLLERRVCPDTWCAWNLARVPGDQALPTRSASSFRNSTLASAWYWSQPHERGKSWAAAGTDLEGSTSGER